MKIFLLGIVFGCVFLPILDSFTSLIISFFEMLKSYIGVKIVKNNQKTITDETPVKQEIGFAYREEVENYDL